MNDSGYERLSRKERMSRTSTQHQAFEQEDELQLADEHRLDSSSKKVEVESRKGNPVLKTVFWLLRKLIAPIIMVFMLAAGLYIGYVIVADQPSDEVFKFETWKHLWDLIFADS